jgi:hypothetical protein
MLGSWSESWLVGRGVPPLLLLSPSVLSELSLSLFMFCWISSKNSPPPSWFSQVLQWEEDEPCASKLVQPCGVVHRGIVTYLFPFLPFHHPVGSGQGKHNRSSFLLLKSEAARSSIWVLSQSIIAYHLILPGW